MRDNSDGVLPLSLTSPSRTLAEEDSLVDDDTDVRTIAVTNSCTRSGRCLCNTSAIGCLAQSQLSKHPLPDWLNIEHQALTCVWISVLKRRIDRKSTRLNSSH